jgi:hypothetical protein
MQNPDLFRRIDLQNLAQAYLRLAEQAERNAETDIVYETPEQMAAMAAKLDTTEH